jgi:predicted kinase
MKTLYLLRGLPGSGKSTLARSLPGDSPYYFEADMYFYNREGEYNFDPKQLGEAHKWCENNVDHAMSFGKHDVIVSNTLTTAMELKPYLKMAETHGYRVVSLVVENRHGNKSIHDVPDETLDKMEKRFSLKLK